MRIAASGRKPVWLGVFVAGALPFAIASDALADETREKELENRVEQLEEQLEQLSEKVRGGYALGYASELEARVAELESATKKDGNGLFWKWDGGFKASTLSKDFKLQVGGRVMNDYTFWESDRDTEAVVGDQLTTGTEFRRARVFLKGTLYGNVHFKTQYDFADGDADFKDVYIAIDTSYGTWTVGHHYEDFGLEENTSSKYIWFVERSAMNDAFNPGRSTGLSFGDDARFGDGPQDYHWQVGVYRDSNAYGDDIMSAGEGEWNWTGRFSARPWVDEDENAFVHVGGSASYRVYSDQMVRYRARPQAHQAPRFVDTGSFAADDGLLLGLDAVARYGSAFVEVEYMTVDVDAIGMSDVDFDGFSAQVGFILTGEVRPWKKGNWSRLKPKQNYDGEGGSGAITVGVRFSTIDLDDGSVEGGDMDIWSVGANWHLNPHTRVMAGVENIDLDRSAGGVDADDVVAFTMRFQIDF